jgi:hypothetical protein
MCHIRLAISETEKVPSARGFYDNMENSLNVVIKARGKFYSYIQGNDYSLDMDRRGRILGIELYLSRDKWVVDPKLAPPEKCQMRQIQILEHRLEVEQEGFYTNEARDIVCIRFTRENLSYYYKIAQNLLFEVNVLDELSAIWVLNLEEDYGFKKEMRYRKGKSVA